MTTSFLLDVADRSEKWYIRPGETKTFDLIARNNSDKLARCLLTVLEPRAGINIQPTTFTLAAAQHVRAQLRLHAPATMGDEMRVIVNLSTNQGVRLASFERHIANAQPHEARTEAGAGALFSIEPADRAGRWYVTPGSSSRYELRVRNAGSSAGAVSVTLDQPADFGSVEPAEFSLGPRESKTITLTFDRDAKVLIGQRAVISVRAPSGKALATFERELYAASDTDCAISLALQRAVAGDDGRPAGAVLACSIKSLSQGPGTFPLEFNQHPTLTWPALPPLELRPGETREFEIPVTWDSSRTDASGFNHPRTLEVGVGVSYGRRSAKVMWETVRDAMRALAPPRPEPAAAERSSALATAPPPTIVAPAKMAATAPPEVIAAVAPPPPAVSAAPHGQVPAEPAPQPPKPDVAADDFLITYGAPPARVLTPPRAPRGRIGMPVIGLIFLGVFLLIAAAYLWLLPALGPSLEVAQVAPAPLPSAILQTLPPAAPPRPRPAHSHKPAQIARAAPSVAPTPAPKPSAKPTPAPTPRVTPRATPHAIRKTIALSPQRALPAASRQPNPPRARPRVDRNGIVALDGLDAQFVLSGRAIRVAWSATAQQSADVALINDRGRVISERRVGPFKRNVLLYLPPHYRGSVLVQIVGFGYHGERVSQTANLIP